MKSYLPAALARTFGPATLALGLSCGLALAPSRLAAADVTNAAYPASQTSPPTQLDVPPEWAGKVGAPPQECRYDGLPLAEVTLLLQEQCKHQFDVLMPESIAHPATGEPLDPSGLIIKLRLKNVSVIEVFQAMNMLFEIEQTPARWELVMNGHRPVAVLRPLELRAAPAVASPQAVSHCVVYVGNLLGTPDLGRMSPEALCKVLEETAQQTFPDSKTRKIQFHRAAELVVLCGMDEELRFMNEVLRALKEKANDQSKGGGGFGGQEAPARK